MVNGGDLLTIGAGPDGARTLVWTPDEDGFMVLSVFAAYAKGSFSQEYDYYFNVGPFQRYRARRGRPAMRAPRAKRTTAGR